MNLYPRNPDGSLASISSIKVIRKQPSQRKKAVVLLHGFLETPEVWQKIIEKLKANQLPYDIYVPMLPFSGLPLDKASAFNNQVITKYIKDYLESLSPQYNKIVVVGLSYSGAQLIFLANKLPQNIQLTLYAPAVFITSNTTIGRLQLSAYSLWRNYCNYKLLGCAFPVYSSGDEDARKFLEHEKNLQYVVVPAVSEMYRFDKKARSKLAKINRPFIRLLSINLRNSIRPTQL